MSPRHGGGRLQSTVTCPTPAEGRPIPGRRLWVAGHSSVETLPDQLSGPWQLRDLPAPETQPKCKRALPGARARHATWCTRSPVVPAAVVGSVPDDPGSAGQARAQLACNHAWTDGTVRDIDGIVRRLRGNGAISASHAFAGQERLPSWLRFCDGRTGFRPRVWAKFRGLPIRCRRSPPAVSGTKSSSRICGGYQATGPRPFPRPTDVFELRSASSSG